MSEQLRYEQQLQQQLNDLPLPDENLAWADMKRRLDEDDDDGGIVWWRSGCLLWGLLLLILIGGGWFLLKPQRWFTTKAEKPLVETQKEQKQTQTQIHNDSATIRFDQRNNQKQPENDIAKKKDQLMDSSRRVIAKENGSNKDNKKVKNEKLSIANERVKTGKPEKTKKEKEPTPSINNDANNRRLVAEKTNPDITAINPSDSSRSIVTIEPANKIDSLGKIKQDTTKQTKLSEKATKKNEDKNKSKNLPPIVFSAGIGIHQQLPIAGQKLTPYNSLGRKGSLADYIPSLYLRMERQKKWFIQSEFRYGAPQYTKEFIYQQKSDTSVNPGFNTVTSLNLKKTFYHQLPLTFNYFGRPNWSIGMGLQWNKFKAAVAEKSVNRRDFLGQQDTLISKIVETLDKDTATQFAKSYFQLVLETQYQWKHFSFGAKYSFGLEPYIRFTLPGQAPKQQKNNVVQLFIRYELWKQKK